MDERLDRFGEFVIRNLRDRMLYELDMLLAGQWKAPDLQVLQKRLTEISSKDLVTVRELVDQVITAGMHDLLLAFQEQSDANGSIRALVDGQDVGQLSDGLQGEIFGEDGWIFRFSEYPAEGQKELSLWAEKKISDLLSKGNSEDGKQLPECDK